MTRFDKRCPNSRPERAQDRRAAAFLPHARAAAMRGLSLVELMVALAISTLIMIVLVQIFAGSRSTYQMDEGLARLQENGRFALDFLEYDIRQAGNKGCRGYIQPKDLGEYYVSYLNNRYTSSLNDINFPVVGYETDVTTPGSSFALPGIYSATPPLTTTTSPALDANLVSLPVATNGVMSGSDVLVVRFMDPANAYDLVADASGVYADALNVHASPNSPIKVGDIVMVTDCKHARIFNATSITPASGGGASWLDIAHVAGPNPTDNSKSSWDDLTNPLKPGAQLSYIRTVAYYIGQGSYGGPSLFRVDSATGISQELVEGVENMQVLYGVDQDDDHLAKPPVAAHNADRYVPASAISTSTMIPPDWSHVVSVRVALLVSTSNVIGQADAAFDTTAAYPVNSVNVAPPASDRHRRRVFTVTINLRNRINTD